MLILEIERQREVRSESRQAAVLWAAVTLVVLLISLFTFGLPVVDPTRRILATTVLALCTSAARCVHHITRYRRASRVLPAYEEAFREEFLPDARFAELGNRSQQSR